MGEVKIEIRNLGVINEAKIDIKKINVIGGINNSGKSGVSKLLYCFLKSDKPVYELLEAQGLEGFKRENVSFKSDSSFSDVFYLETISILDLMHSQIQNFEYIKHLEECLDIDDELIDETNSKILDAIRGIVDNDTSNIVFSSAGIKQISLIEILLKNKSLKEDSFLIIDEPESNLHPSWQIKFAHILVLLSKEMNITLYLNSHSPIFIEAISLYSQYYDLLDQTSFYLTQKTDNGKYDFKKINPRDMGEVYENLTGAYDELDRLKAKIIFKE